MKPRWAHLLRPGTRCLPQADGPAVRLSRVPGRGPLGGGALLPSDEGGTSNPDLCRRFYRPPSSPFAEGACGTFAYLRPKLGCNEGEQYYELIFEQFSFLATPRDCDFCMLPHSVI